ncbi:MAG TPA: sulfite exporter TauE/SafE family protein [Actinobacteria bacterium]|nr:sulfite exporter TauE/SafE family protein [Actinomycetota bacterium]
MSRVKKSLPVVIVAIALLFLLAEPVFAAGAIEVFKGNRFIELTLVNTLFLFVVGFIGGLVSGFIGSGGAFVLTPGMMSLGVPGAVAVASNMAHKFPKAMIGSYKRYKYGQVDLKLGLVMAVSATVGVQLGIKLQQYISHMWGAAGSNLYVSFSFVLVLITVGGYVFYDAWKIKKTGGVEGTASLAQRLQKINIPPMMHFKTANLTISMWFTVPVGLATGLLAATIAVGGFIGVPGMMYVIGASSLVASATELVVAFLMGLTGSIQWGMVGMIDIRLTLIILAGSLFGVQLGALGTTYVKEHMIKVVMGSIMLVVAISRGFAIPEYTNQLGLTSVADQSVQLMSNISFVIMVFALGMGAIIILTSMFKEMRNKKPAAEVGAGELEKAVNQR